MKGTDEIRTYSFDNDGLNELKSFEYGKNWPVVYLIHNNKDLYIGETTSAEVRMSQHLSNNEKNYLEEIAIVFDHKFNKSVILDYEQRLIKYCSVDSRFQNILNKNKGQQAIHDYYNRDEYRSDFERLWNSLKSMGLADHTLHKIENENIFKFSPYNCLTGEQNEVGTDIIMDIIDTFTNDKKGISLVNGCAGTGKTVVAISIINSLMNTLDIEEDSVGEFDDDIDKQKIAALKELKDYILKERNGKPFKIGFVLPMPGFRRTISNVFKECGNGLVKDMVIGPCDVVKEDYDILFVDESHRLSKRKNLTGYGSFDSTSRQLGLDPNKTNQLEWVLNCAKHVVLFYDQYQAVKSSDLTVSEYQDTLNKYSVNLNHHELKTQMRCKGGAPYIEYIKAIMNCTNTAFKTIENYDFLLFDDPNTLIEEIRKKDDQYTLCKTVAGFSWDWKTKPSKKPKDDLDTYLSLVEKDEYDISFGEQHYIWNLWNEDWITREDSHYTIGCIHTTQGYDMNYVGVIFGKEIDYDPVSNSIVIDLNEYRDKKVKAGMDEDELKKLIINTYTTILARGIKGCYVYACNKNLQNYLRQFIAAANDYTLK